MRLTSEIGVHNKIQSDCTNHRPPTGEIGGFDWTYGSWLSNELISCVVLLPGPTGGPLSLIGLPIVSPLRTQMSSDPLFPRALISDEAISSAVEQSCSQFGVESLKPLQRLARSEVMTSLLVSLPATENL